MGVVGVGGLFFRSRDPEGLSAWYKEHLGIGAGCNAAGEGNPDDWYWQTAGGPTVFAPFKAHTDYFPADKAFMMNLRVDRLDQLMESLRTSGVHIITKPEWDDPATGRFARIHDPEGNPIELWEPPTNA